jgi:hypothetical protein
MFPSPEFIAAIEEDRHRDEARHHEHHRALLQARVERPSWRTRFATAILNAARRDHSLTDYPCRLRDGSPGRVAAVLVDGEWTLVCRVA